MTISGYRVPFWREENILKLSVVMAAQLYAKKITGGKKDNWYTQKFSYLPPTTRYF